MHYLLIKTLHKNRSSYILATKNKILYFIFLFLIFFNNNSYENDIVVLIPSFNNSQWYKKNLNSVFNQSYTNYRIIYIDDCSTDGTTKLVETYIKEKKQEHRTTLIKNKIRVTAMENLYKAIHFECKDNEIIVKLDGDDWLAHNNVLQRINQEYQDPNIWLTYGNYQDLPNHKKKGDLYCKPISNEFLNNGGTRKVDKIIQIYAPGHPLTFKAWLFKKIKLKDIFYEGKFPKTAYDATMNFPLIEMARNNHKFIAETLYIHNKLNPINDHKVDAYNQTIVGRSYRFKKPYKKINLKKNINNSNKPNIKIDLIYINKNSNLNLNRYTYSSLIENAYFIKKNNIYDQKNKNISIEQIKNNNNFILITDKLPKIDIKKLLNFCFILKSTHAEAFFLNIQRQTLKDQNIPHVHMVDDIYCWQFKYGLTCLIKNHSVLYPPNKIFKKIKKPIDFYKYLKANDELDNKVNIENIGLCTENKYD